MNTVIVVSNARGDISFITQDLEKTKTHLRNLGLHPLKNQTHAMTWFGHKNDFVFSLREYDVADV